MSSNVPSEKPGSNLQDKPSGSDSENVIDRLQNSGLSIFKSGSMTPISKQASESEQEPLLQDEGSVSNTSIASDKPSSFNVKLEESEEDIEEIQIVDGANAKLEPPESHPVQGDDSSQLMPGGEDSMEYAGEEYYTGKFTLHLKVPLYLYK